MARTVIEHVLSRLRDIGVTDVFGVPGDYSFAVSDAVCNDPDLQWVGCCNELNAAYAADGYARIRGVAALSTTYGVGELSAINGIAGAYAEHLPIFHLVGTPNMATQSARALMHHTLGNGEYDLYRRMSEPVVCAQAVMTPQNVAWETERLIAEALYHRRPVYMAFPADLANQPVAGEAPAIAAPRSNAAQLARAADEIVAALQAAGSACVLPGILVQRAGARAAMQALIDASGLPFATMFMAKSVLDEQQPGYVGMYDGALMNPEVRDFVEGADRVLVVGSPMTDFNTGAFTARLDARKTITIGHHRTLIDGRVHTDVEMGELLAALAQRLPRRDWKRIAAGSLGAPAGRGGDAIDASALYPRWAGFIRPDDVVVAETGTVSMGLGFARLPRGAGFHNQTLWGSIGWATPAAFGAAVAAPGRRVLLLTGDGSHQLTAQEIGQFGRLGLKPVVFVLNNSGYLIERLLNKDPAIAYNDIAPWRYAELPHALGCDGWMTARVTTCDELDDAMAAAATAEAGVYIEVVTDAYAASPLAQKLGDALKAMRKGE
ncbi:alpha-keto acid decarboxylase family protein [Variovorax saccharolyticus]|uniref:alpha-keto acid decarboxylase family protein n=1 Tax=Variovorax saccharolyticus TaxID=3053516 RepID=UPI0025791CB8|nr:thiamine pyrophosphate-binding protein [Variovorax sp. J22R187]MDM0018780.1 thiamine pyrophosphate-binding protein [Variovorax sp. J22R187]